MLIIAEMTHTLPNRLFGESMKVGIKARNARK
jgi:hypothetical protein